MTVTEPNPWSSTSVSLRVTSSLYLHKLLSSRACLTLKGRSLSRGNRSSTVLGKSQAAAGSGPLSSGVGLHLGHP